MIFYLYVWSVQLPLFSGKVAKSTHYLILIGLILTIVLYTLKASVYTLWSLFWINLMCVKYNKFAKKTPTHPRYLNKLVNLLKPQAIYSICIYYCVCLYFKRNAKYINIYPYICQFLRLVVAPTFYSNCNINLLQSLDCIIAY